MVWPKDCVSVRVHTGGARAPVLGAARSVQDSYCKFLTCVLEALLCSALLRVGLPRSTVLHVEYRLLVLRCTWFWG